MKKFKELKIFFDKTVLKGFISNMKISFYLRKFKFKKSAIDNLKHKLQLFSDKNKTNKSEEVLKEIISKEYILISYAEEYLLISEILESGEAIKVGKIFDINLPNSVISKDKVVDSKALSDILKNIFYLLNNPINKPILLNLDSSLFMVKSFTSGKESQVINPENPIIIANSPYISENTLSIFKYINQNKSANVIYTNKEIIDSWLNVLKNLDNPIIGISNGFIQLVNNISLTNNSRKNFIVADIGLISSNIFYHSTSGEIISSKLPYGTELYNASNEDLRIQFFKRLESSINLFLSDQYSSNDCEILLGGRGLYIVEKEIKKISNNFILIGEKLNYKISFNESKDSTKEKGNNFYYHQIYPFNSKDIQYNALEEYKSIKIYKFKRGNNKSEPKFKIKKISKEFTKFSKIFIKNKVSFYPTILILLLTSIIWIITIPSLITINKLKDEHNQFKEASQKLKINNTIINQKITNLVELSSIYRNQAPVYLFSKFLQESIIPNQTKLNGYLVNNNGFNLEMISENIDSINKVIKLLKNNPIINKNSLSIEIIRSLNSSKEFNNKILLKLNGKLKNLTLEKRLEFSKKYNHEGLYTKLKPFSKINNLFK